jgi:predicted regulator of Ras-like GTPase activity (Roadblock/LC7/MglB family)
MDAPAALERLREISSQVRSAVVFERGGKVLGSSPADEERAKRVADEAAALLGEAERRRPEAEAKAEFAQLEVALREGSVFVVRHDDRVIAATTTPEPTVGLVFYDLKSCLRELETPEADTPKKAPAKRGTTTTRKKTETTARKKTDAKP